MPNRQQTVALAFNCHESSPVSARQLVAVKAVSSPASLSHLHNQRHSFIGSHFRPSCLNLFVSSEAMDSTAVNCSLPEFRDVFPDYHKHDELYKFSIQEVFFQEPTVFHFHTAFKMKQLKNKKESYHLPLLILLLQIFLFLQILIFAISLYFWLGLGKVLFLFLIKWSKTRMDSQIYLFVCEKR